MATLNEASRSVGWTGAETPDQHVARIAVWGDEIRKQWEARGYEEGRLSCPCQDDPRR